MKSPIINKYIQELQEFEITSEEDGIFTDNIPVQDAVDILQRFEVELINELTCEDLEQLKLKEWI